MPVYSTGPSHCRDMCIYNWWTYKVNARIDEDIAELKRRNPDRLRLIRGESDSESQKD